MKKVIPIATILLFVIVQLVFSDTPGSASYVPPAVYSKKVASTPDLMQRNSKLTNSGISYCAPVAVTNSLAWLAAHEFPKLLPTRSRDMESAMLEVAGVLGSAKYMNTDPNKGTGCSGVMKGVSRYIRDRGYEYERLEMQGWRKHARAFPPVAAIPQLAWIKKGLIGKSAVWLNVGWYKYDQSTNEYNRIGGHWVTLVGYERDRRRKDPTVLIIHDPAPRAGRSFSNEFVSVEKIQSGTLTGEKAGLPRNAEGYYKLGSGMHLNKKADVAILDVTVVLEMETTGARAQEQKGAGKDERASTRPSARSARNPRSSFNSPNAVE